MDKSTGLASSILIFVLVRLAWCLNGKLISAGMQYICNRVGTILSCLPQVNGSNLSLKHTQSTEMHKGHRDIPRNYHMTCGR
ncbi:hypothetical protein BO99DRAFT_221265 [Aspergillus violaceofuscus CBS 115571]|uniref:Secreted protein n=1 Tax=Aspergillus violaceofuscus (strain CBS 115571) TaxID=1450538 RepID=A0A2V5H4E2_ASPV1|nr:hypothetical protein BO99DRAFT_221265 [Aspergillus violaceofuscus CBS 115571]